MDRSFERTLGRALFLAFAVFAVLVFRRPDQFLNPCIWAEDGAVCLPQYLAHGWHSIFDPVAGYLILPTKVIFVTAARLSFLDQPTISYWLMMIFTFWVVICIAFSPTYLERPMLCALAVLLVPTDAEVFAVPLFAFWWGTFLALLPLLWRHGEHPHTILRCLMVAVGGLSSPLIIALTVLYAIRFLYFKSRTDAIILVSAMAIAYIQITTIIHSTGNLALYGSSELSKEIFYLTIAKFFGYYLYFDHPRILALPLGIFIILLIGASIIYYRKHLLFGDWMVLACLLLAILASIVRAPLSLINPVNAGPRYFFFPFVLLSWTLLQLTARVDSSLSVLFVLVLLLSLRQTALVGQRFHDRLDWKSEVLACSHSEFYHLPIHTDGKLERLWHVRLTRTECRQLLAQSLIKYASE